MTRSPLGSALTARTVALTVCVAVAACGGEPASDAAPAEVGSGGPAAVPTPPQPGAVADMVADMRSELVMLESAGGDELLPLVPEHARSLGSLIDAMAREQNRDGAWHATADSIRRDLAEMPSMTQVELETLMEDHIARVSRLIEASNLPGP